MTARQPVESNALSKVRETGYKGIDRGAVLPFHQSRVQEASKRFGSAAFVRQSVSTPGSTCGESMAQAGVQELLHLSRTPHHGQTLVGQDPARENSPHLFAGR